MLQTVIAKAAEVEVPLDVRSAVPPPRPSFMGLSCTSMADPAPDQGEPDVEFARGFMPASGMTLLGAQEGAGKSLVAVALAAVTAMRRPNKSWCDFDILRTGRTLLVFAEGKERMHKARMKATCINTYGLDDEETRFVMGQVEIISLRTRLKELKARHPTKNIARRLFVKKDGRSDEYVPSEMLNSIFDHVRATNEWADKWGRPEDRIVLVIFDTLQALYGVKLIDDEAINDANQHMNAELDALRCAGLLLAHTNKSSTAEDDDPRTSIKGSQQIQATVESVALLRSMTEEEYEATRRAGLDMPREKALAIRPGKANGLAPEKHVRLLRGLADGAPIGITASVRGGVTRGGYTRREVRDAVLRLWLMLHTSDNPRISANAMARLADDSSFIAKHELRPLAGATKEGSRSDGGMKISDMLEALAAEGVLQAGTYKNGRIYGRGHKLEQAVRDLEDGEIM